MAALEFTPEARLRLYKVAAASVPLLLLLKLITPEFVEPILTFLAAALGVSAPVVAAVNISDGSADES